MPGRDLRQLAVGRVTRAVLLDALGTIVELEPPAPRLRERLAEHGIEVALEGAERAMWAEISYYRAHLHLGRDADGLAELRRRCAEIVRSELPAGERVPFGVVADALAWAIRFRPYADVVPALRALRARGVRCVVASNWDISLHEALAATGLDAELDGAVSSAEAGAAKPDPRLFAAALRVAGAEASEALHAGDDLEADVHGALGAGMRAVLVARNGSPGTVPAGVEVLPSLEQLPRLV
jgi:putative hydrolase of the HAD superfamily